jgi:hypothetical protein
MTTMVENEKSSARQPDKPDLASGQGFGSAAVRFDKVEADMREGFTRVDQDMREGFARVDQDIRDLRGEMNTRFLALEARFGSLQHTLIASALAIVAALIGVKVF